MTNDKATRQAIIDVLLDEGKDNFHSQRIARRIELAISDLQPVNKTDEDKTHRTNTAGDTTDAEWQHENAIRNYKL